MTKFGPDDNPNINIIRMFPGSLTSSTMLSIASESSAFEESLATMFLSLKQYSLS